MSSYVCPVKAGHILFELRNVDAGAGTKALLRAAVKLPLNTSIVKLKDMFSSKIA